ncbi:unnamed protein product [Timema podura]|uniref:Uncharacterized protein n=1 Tax=Timema podura TaxID=61482 RepID=A0ABN7P9A1_TIMPD|nr:unnamed protein product [Timema podura]
MASAVRRALLRLLWASREGCACPDSPHLVIDLENKDMTTLFPNGNLAVSIRDDNSVYHAQNVSVFSLARQWPCACSPWDCGC